jgi:hypothetical protein
MVFSIVLLLTGCVANPNTIGLGTIGGILGGVRLGLKRVRESGKKLGQPTKISEGLIHQIWSLKDQGLGLTQITDEVSVSRSTVYKILKMDRVHV